MLYKQGLEAIANSGIYRYDYLEFSALVCRTRGCLYKDIGCELSPTCFCVMTKTNIYTV